MNWWQRIQHGVMNWHPQATREVLDSDCVNLHVRCTVCGLTGMVDSQGNIF